MSVCIIGDCGKSPRMARGLCSAHYYKARDNGVLDQYPTLGRGKQEAIQPRRPCAVDGCEGASHGRGLCRTHYGRQRAARPLEGRPPARPPEPRETRRLTGHVTIHLTHGEARLIVQSAATIAGLLEQRSQGPGTNAARDAAQLRALASKVQASVDDVREGRA